MGEPASLSGRPDDLWPELPQRLRAALDWLVRSERPEGGSAAYFMPLRGWGRAYPETTGYSVPTLYRGADRFGAPELAEVAERFARWLLTLQHPEGWFSAGPVGGRGEPTPSIFNTGQIVFGLVAAFRRTSDGAFSEASERAVAWLLEEMDESGRWPRWAYRTGHVPDYYAHVCWPLAEHWRLFGGDELREAVTRAMDVIVSDRRKNGTFRRWGFEPDGPAPTHTIAYTLQGLLETARILDRMNPYGELAVDSLERLMRRFEIDKRLGGAYDREWRPVLSYRCLTGHCQLASAWISVFRLVGDPRPLNVAVRALREVASRQRLTGSDGRRGAIAGSAPFWGRYLPLRYPNWAAKFYADALMESEYVLGELLPAPVPPGGTA